METGLQFNLVDVVVLIYVAFGAVRGAIRGLSGELARLLTLAAAVAAAVYLYQPAGQALIENTRAADWDPGLIMGGTFLAILIGAWLAMRVVRWMLAAIMEFAFRGWLEYVGGLLAGLVRHGLIAATVLLLVGMIPVEAIQTWVVQDSVLGGAVAQYGRPAYEQWLRLHPDWPLAPMPQPESQDVPSP